MDFSNDIILELLLRLPVKSVMRFKCVSPEWNDMISDAAFRKNYLSRHTKNAPTGFFYHHQAPKSSETGHNLYGPAKFINTTTNNVKTQEFQSLDYSQKFGHVIASSKGLLLLSKNPNSYHVFDPVSKKCIKLPKPLKKQLPRVSVGFISHEQERTNGHNVNVYSLSYKVVRIGLEFCSYKAKTWVVEPYSSKTSKWKKSKIVAPLGFNFGPELAAKVIGGVYHWWGWSASWIVAYNPDNNPKGRVKLIKSPRDMGVDECAYSGIEGTQNGCLQFYKVGASIQLWILKGKHEGGSYLDEDEDIVEVNRWTLAHRISFWEIGIKPCDVVDDFKIFPVPIAISPWNPHIIFFQSPYKLMSYDRTDRKIEVFSTHKFETRADEFVPFEWPVWPCL
ncbi:hypothetical protein Vadar_004238 [Vaccinium darrowii]|uniref:Uncharacterized protein n=1 Tax=Vaccinium darrowii TaxID=229202 RepID=A0ACB7XWF8_9ERIC|nr:hypothetical protein Vadar_004238 [Vaccinium darrowii]